MTILARARARLAAKRTRQSLGAGSAAAPAGTDATPGESAHTEAPVPPPQVRPVSLVAWNEGAPFRPSMLQEDPMTDGLIVVRDGGREMADDADVGTLKFTPTERQRTHIATVWGQLLEGEGNALAALARDMPDGFPILEIGSLQGLSSCWLAFGAGLKAHPPHIYCLDAWRTRRVDTIYGVPGPGGVESHARFVENIADLGYPGEIIPVEADSREVGKVWRIPVGLLLIDADHSYKGALADYQAYAPWVVPRGFLAMHDYRDGYDVQTVCDRDVLPSGEWENVRQTGVLLTMQRRAT